MEISRKTAIRSSERSAGAERGDTRPGGASSPTWAGYKTLLAGSAFVFDGLSRNHGAFAPLLGHIFAGFYFKAAFIFMLTIGDAPPPANYRTAPLRSAVLAGFGCASPLPAAAAQWPALRSAITIIAFMIGVLILRHSPGCLPRALAWGARALPAPPCTRPSYAASSLRSCLDAPPGAVRFVASKRFAYAKSVDTRPERLPVASGQGIRSGTCTSTPGSLAQMSPSNHDKCRSDPQERSAKIPGRSGFKPHPDRAFQSTKSAGWSAGCSERSAGAESGDTRPACHPGMHGRGTGTVDANPIYQKLEAFRKSGMRRYLDRSGFQPHPVKVLNKCSNEVLL